MGNTIRIRCSGRVVEATFDMAQLRGDALEQLEERLGGESVLAWLRRVTSSISEGFRPSEYRTRDLIALFFVGAAQGDPEETWERVSRSIAPYTMEFVGAEVPLSPTALGMQPQQAAVVAPPVAEPAPEPTASPALAVLDEAAGRHSGPNATAAPLFVDETSTV